MAVRAAGGATLLHIIDGKTGFMYLPEIEHALSFKDEYAIEPEVLATLPPLLQNKIKAMGAKIGAWTERDRAAFKNRDRATEIDVEPEAPARKPGRPRKSEAQASAQ